MNRAQVGCYASIAMRQKGFFFFKEQVLNQMSRALKKQEFDDVMFSF